MAILVYRRVDQFIECYFTTLHMFAFDSAAHLGHLLSFLHVLSSVEPRRCVWHRRGPGRMWPGEVDGTHHFVKPKPYLYRYIYIYL